MEWMILPLKRYADFSGRSRRLEYWMFMLFLFLVLVGGVMVLAALGAVLEPAGSSEASALELVFVAICAIAYLAIFIPALAVQVRRFHDQDLSGWFVLLGFIPYLGGLILLIFMCIDRTRGPNRFGPDPKGRDAFSEVFG